MDQQKIRLKVYGARGSYSVDGVACNKVGGLTSCLAFDVGGRRLIFDAGSGLQRFCNDHDRKKNHPIYLFLSHLHLDHIIGLVSFSPLYAPSSRIHLFGPHCDRYESFEEALQTIFSPPFHPVNLWETRAQKSFYDYLDGDIIAFKEGVERPDIILSGEIDEEEYPVSIACLRNYSHPKSGITIFCIRAYGKRIIYATDVEGRVDLDTRVAEFAKGCDLLIHDSMYTDISYNNPQSPRRGFGHSTQIEAVNMALRYDVKQLLLFHHDPDCNDDEIIANFEAAKKAFPATKLACGGDTFEI